MPDFASGILLGVVIGLLVGFLIARRLGSRSAGTPLLDSILDRQAQETTASGSAPAAAALRQNLRLKCLYDESLVDRLIEAERERNPNGGLEELMQAAITRWERDNR